MSEVLREITLTVSNTSFNHTKMFGTEAARNENGTVKDACGGDSGGPLMYQDPDTGRWIILGWLKFKCKKLKKKRVLANMDMVDMVEVLAAK